MAKIAQSSVRARLKRRKQQEKEAQQLRFPSSRRAFVELSEDYKWIEIWFPYSPGIKTEVAKIDNAHFKDKNSGGPKWRVPRDLQTCDKLREIFGPTEFWENPNTGRTMHLKGLWIGDALRSWARQQRSLEQNLGQLTSAKDAKLKRIKKDSRIARAIAGEPIPELELPPLPNGKPHPLMVEREPRPYQRADIRIMAIANVMNCNQPGTGKTIETIGSWVESDALEQGPILVVGPVKSLENTWLKEILRWLGDRDDVVIYTDENPLYRARQVESFLDSYENEEFEGPAILCVNFDWLRLVMTHKKGKPIMSGIERCTGFTLNSREPDDETRNREKRQLQLDALAELGVEPEEGWMEEDRLEAIAEASGIHARKDHKGNYYGYSNDLQRRLLNVDWSAVTVDEFHKSGMNNRLTLFYMGVELLKADWKSALSGTPMGGKPRKLWPILHWIEPEEYTAEWSWINRWLETETGHSARSKIVKAIKKGREEEFGKAHARHLIRRTKLAVLPGLPPRTEQVIWSKMTDKQYLQYKEFSRTLEIKIEEERLSANNVLTEYLRLKQFANAMQRLVDGVPYPTEESGKLEDIWNTLDENGVRPLKDDPEPGARAIIGSESSRMVHMITAWLNRKGIPADALVGGVDSEPIIERFKHGGPEPYIIVMTVQTGGVSLDLEEAWCMLAVDETWNPDDIEQFFERGDRSTRETALNCYIFRSRDTIQEYIAQVNEGKAVTNKTVLDIRRRIHEAEELD
jgi:SNF2 family DNA or RNA helicase